MRKKQRSLPSRFWHGVHVEAVRIPHMHARPDRLQMFSIAVQRIILDVRTLYEARNQGSMYLSWNHLLGCAAPAARMSRCALFAALAVITSRCRTGRVIPHLRKMESWGTQSSHRSEQILHLRLRMRVAISVDRAAQMVGIRQSVMSKIETVGPVVGLSGGDVEAGQPTATAAPKRRLPRQCLSGPES